MNKNKTKILAIGLAAACLVTMTAFSASAKWNRLSAVGFCDGANGTTNIYPYSGGYIKAVGSGNAVCGLPNTDYMPISLIKYVNAHFYNASSTVTANICTRGYNSEVTDCEATKSTSAIGEVTLSWTGVSLTRVADAGYMWASMGSGDKLRLIYLTE